MIQLVTTRLYKLENLKRRIEATIGVHGYVLITHIMNLKRRIEAHARCPMRLGAPNI